MQNHPIYTAVATTGALQLVNQIPTNSTTLENSLQIGVFLIAVIKLIFPKLFDFRKQQEKNINNN